MMDLSAKTMTLEITGFRRDLLRETTIKVELPLYGRVQTDIDGYTYYETIFMVDSCKAIGAQLTIAAGSVVGARLFYDDETLRLMQSIVTADPEDRYPVRRATREEFVEQLAQASQWTMIEAQNLLRDMGAEAVKVPVMNEG